MSLIRHKLSIQYHTAMAALSSMLLFFIFLAKTGSMSHAWELHEMAMERCIRAAEEAAKEYCRLHPED